MDLLSKRPQRLAWAAIAVTVFLAILAGVIANWSHSQLAAVIVLPMITALAFAIAAVWRAVLVRRVAEEHMEHERLRQQYARNDLFDETDTGEQLAKLALRSFDRYVTPGIAIVAAVIQAVSVWQLWHLAGHGMPVNAERDALGAAGLSLFMAVFCLLGGSYFNGLSREIGNRRLRPVAGWLYLGAAMFAALVLAMLAERSGHVGWDLFAAKIALVLIGLFAAELIANCVMELYRPRAADDDPRPLYESRILALLTEPGGLASNVAHALDYQFGFQVSETWFYRFLERSVLPFFLLTAASFYLLDCVYKVDTGELALVERFGKPATDAPEGPGLYLKLPRPFHTVRKFQVDKVRQLNVGFTVAGDSHDSKKDEPPMDPEGESRKGDESGRVIVWNKTHFKEETQYLVASSEQDAAATKGMGIVPVNIVTTNVPVHYTISADPEGLRNYAYSYRNSEEVLRQVVTSELVRFLASRDLVRLLGANREAAQEALSQQVRQAVAAHQPPLGIEIRFVGIMGIHPTAEVGESFQNVAGATEERQTKVLAAEKYAATVRNQTNGQAARTVLEAEAYRLRKSRVASAEAYRFEKQLAAWKVAPDIYRERLFLDVLEETAADRRTFVVATPNAKEVLVLDLVEQLRKDLLNDLDLNRPDN